MKKSVLVSILFAILSITSYAQELGEDEREGVEKFKSEKLPELQKNIDDAAGFAVPLEINWDQIAGKGQASSYNLEAYWEKPIFIPLAQIFAKLGKDKIGKSNLSKIKKVVLMYDEKKKKTTGVSYENNVTYANGVVTLNLQPYSNGDPSDIEEKVKFISRFLNSKIK